MNKPHMTGQELQAIPVAEAHPDLYKREQLGLCERARGNSFTEERPMEKIPQRKKPFCSHPGAQSTKLELEPVIKVTNLPTPEVWGDSRDERRWRPVWANPPVHSGPERNGQMWLQKRPVRRRCS
ncbi:hypothetical protein GWK47_003368 [Chionoecetes opilio]|uniref:Uncharacterized protein n=1 Tax=Chionoecetes opilio TaxID=41210 RepID=A0A8J5D347_CHIOP|nr:hypothetical protein GWK47_003368 [Chionoecetes opilio]